MDILRGLIEGIKNIVIRIMLSMVREYHKRQACQRDR